ncbi:MAG: hypothetical protein CSA49_01145 [Gammaproteobacteria bacterium]|nr:MAG: hypothetical protein CSA49_01145 [Gammaproteobacteria bacterium]
MKELHIALWGKDNFKIYTPLIALKDKATLLILGSQEQEKTITSSLQSQHGTPLFLAWNNEPNEEDFYRLYETITDLNADRICLNLSTGDRLNAMRLLQWALKEDIHAYLIDDEDQQQWLNPSNLPATQIHDLANLKEYFRVHQIELVKHGMGMRITDELKRLVEQWIIDFDNIGPYRHLNRLASSAKPDHPGSISTSYTSKIDQHWQQSQSSILLTDLADHQLLTCHNDSITFANGNIRFFCNGGWLELFVYHQLCKLKRSINELQDVRLGLEVLYPAQIKNELDVVFLANNQLYIIEVKTSYLSRDTNAANQLIYKLEALSEALGNEVKGMLVSLSELPHHSIKRAGLYDIEVVAGQEIKNLPSRLIQWMK